MTPPMTPEPERSRSVGAGPLVADWAVGTPPVSPGGRGVGVGNGGEERGNGRGPVMGDLVEKVRQEAYGDGNGNGVSGGGGDSEPRADSKVVQDEEADVLEELKATETSKSGVGAKELEQVKSTVSRHDQWNLSVFANGK